MDQNTPAGDANTPAFWAEFILAQLKRSSRLVESIEKKISIRIRGTETDRKRAADNLKEALMCDSKRMAWLIEDRITTVPNPVPANFEGKLGILSVFIFACGDLSKLISLLATLRDVANQLANVNLAFCAELKTIMERPDNHQENQTLRRTLPATYHRLRREAHSAITQTLEILEHLR